jgi:uncharacterized membrane protein YhaH (DUF805 family)
MNFNEYNNNFFSWEGLIGQKDYAINMAILFVVVFLLQFINFKVLFGEQNFLVGILDFLAQFLQFVFVISILSVVYRRINDFTVDRPLIYKKVYKVIFIALFLFPVLYFYIFAYFLDFIPILVKLLNIVCLFTAILGFIASVVFCFIKGKTRN